jgi:hypothetical protein
MKFTRTDVTRSPIAFIKTLRRLAHVGRVTLSLIKADADMRSHDKLSAFICICNVVSLPAQDGLFKFCNVWHPEKATTRRHSSLYHERHKAKNRQSDL